MAIGIVQVVNNTSTGIRYTNSESGHGFSVDAKTTELAKAQLIPSSSYHYDQVPYKSSGKVIEIRPQGGESRQLQITDDNYKFNITGYYDSSFVESSDRFGSLVSGGKYILRIDEVHDGISKRLGFSFLKYNDDCKAADNAVSSRVLQRAEPDSGIILLDTSF